MAQESQEALLGLLSLSPSSSWKKLKLVPRGDRLKWPVMIPSKKRYSLKDTAAF